MTAGLSGEKQRGREERKLRELSREQGEDRGDSKTSKGKERLGGFSVERTGKERVERKGFSREVFKGGRKGSRGRQLTAVERNKRLGEVLGIDG